jgi:hypothetical protein
MTDPSLAAPVELPGELHIRGILSQAFNILSQNFAPIALLSGLSGLAILPDFVFGALGTTPETHPGWAALASISGVIVQYLMLGFVPYAAFRNILNQHARAGEALAVALARFFPILGVVICVVFACALGGLMLIVPGIIWFVMWSVAVPACVVERLGPIQSMRRSAALTKGHRWKIFGIFVLLFVLTLICQAVLVRVLLSAGGVWTYIIGLRTWSALVIAFGVIVTTIIYHDLRAAKEGADIEQVAAVFA